MTNQLALNGGPPVFKANPAAGWPEYDEREERGLIQALHARGWGGFPEPMPIAGRFGENFARFHDASHGICVANGSVSLEVAMNALRVRAGDEVIVPAYTWIATGAAPIHCNAVPVLVDIDPHTYCIDAEAVAAAVTDKTVGIIPVHLGSLMADMDRLNEIATAHGLWIVEDCAHAHGAKWRERGAGSWGAIGSFSFQTTKLMTSGEGGAVITSDNDLAERLHCVTNCGRKEPGYDGFAGTHLGVNARLSEFQAAVLEGQLERLEENTAIRAAAATYLEENLTPLGITALTRDPRITQRAVYELVMRYDSNSFAGASRERFLEALAAEGVQMDGDFYIPMTDSPLFEAQSAQWPQLRPRYGDGIVAAQKAFDFPVASAAAYREAVWLHHTYLSAGDEVLKGIVEAVTKIKANSGEL